MAAAATISQGAEMVRCARVGRDGYQTAFPGKGMPMLSMPTAP